MHYDPSPMVTRRSPSAQWPHLIDANMYAVPGLVPTATETQALTADLLYIFPWFCPLPLAITSAGIVCTSLDAGATETVSALFNWDQENREVRSLVQANATSFDTSSTGSAGLIANTTDFPLVLEPGWYAWGLVSDGTPTLRLAKGVDPMSQGNFDISTTTLVGTRYYTADGSGMVAGGITDPGDYSDLTEITSASDFTVAQAIVTRFNLNPAVPA